MRTMRVRLVVQWALALLSIACVTVAIGLHSTPASAAPLALYANKTADDTGTDPGDCTTPTNTDCSLRAALALSNANAGSTLNVAAGTFTLTHADATDVTSGLVASASVTIAGAGAASTFIEANAAPNTATYRVLHITGANVTVQGVTIRNGVVAVTSELDGGGGVRVDAAGTLIQDSTIIANAASGTDITVYGGGIAMFGGNTTLLRTTVSSNMVTETATSGTRSSRGGGAAAVSGPLTVQESLIVGNVAQGTASGGTLQTIGGGVYNQNTAPISNSTLATNSANGGLPFGGGLANLATMTVTSSTLTGNSAIASGNSVPQGGGIHNQSVVTFTNSIIANSTGGDLHTNGGTVAGDNNLFDDNSILPTGTGNMNNTPALLGTLGSYGGPTQTVPLLPGSPAIDAGAAIGSGPTGPPANTVPATDQRGKPRVNAPDIGAFESQGFTMTKQSGGDNQSAPTTGVYANALAVSLTPVNPGEPVNGGQVTFTVVPNAGASATFGTLAGCTVSGDGLTAVCTIASGKATSPPLTANDTAGAFTVTAAATGAPTQTFHLTSIAITLVVNTATDGVGDFTRCATGNANTCRLRDAIAGATASKHTITFADAAFPANTPTTILLTANTFSLNTTVTVDGTGHMVVLNGGCTSCGIGGNPTNGVRVLVVQKTGVVTFIGLTITGGNNNAGPSAGILNAGTLTLTNSTVRGNYAPNGDGGGIGNDGGTLTLVGSIVTGNTATRGGGGIYNYDDQVFSGGKVTLINSTVSGNAAVGGGGIFNYSGKMTIVGSTVNGNTVSSQGGGISNEPGSTFALVNSTVSGNTASAEGGGIYFLSGTGTLTNVTVSGNTGSKGGGLFNSSATVIRSNSIVAGNTQTSGGDEGNDPGYTFTGSNNLIGGDPKLAPLGNNGGSTQTMLPLPNSPAINAYAPTSGNCGSYTDPITAVATSITTDQRGIARPQGAACDIGAVEVPSTLALLSVSPASGGTAGGNKVTLTGTGFGTAPASVQVRVDGTAIPAGSIVSVTDTQIVYLAPAHAAGNATVMVVVGGTTAPGSVTYTYGTVSPLPGGPLPGGPSTSGSGNPNPLPGTRPDVSPSGSPNPIPGSRP